MKMLFLSRLRAMKVFAVINVLVFYVFVVVTKGCDYSCNTITVAFTVATQKESFL